MTTYFHDSITPFVYLDQLDEKTSSILNDILVNKTEDHKHGFLQSILDSNSNNKIFNVRIFPNENKSKSTEMILDIASTFFGKAGFYTNKDSGYIDYCSYEKAISQSYLSPYCANEEYRGCNVCIIVTKKEENIKGGNMIVYKNNLNDEVEEKYVYNLKTGSVIIFDGDTYHDFQSFKGQINYIIVTLSDNEEEI